MAGTLQDLDITRDELDSIGKALKNEEFRKLLVEYCEEIKDPASRKQYEEEIAQLERERGVEVTFINPTSGFVIKTSVEGNKIAFINICTNENVPKPFSKPSNRDGARGVNWSVPHYLSPPREDLSKKGKRCTVYDVIFHPEALKLANNNKHFRDLVNNVACEAIESNYNVVLDKTNLKFPKMQYKGMARPLVIRKKVNDVPDADMNDPVNKMYADMYKKMDDKPNYASNKKSKAAENTTKSQYATPNYLIKHRCDVDLQNFTNDTNAHINATVPKELVVEIDLPLLKSSSDLVLDVTEKSVSLISEKPSKYKLNINLPYSVDEDDGSAKFDQDRRKLIITLPVKRKCNLLLTDISHDSGVDSDNNSPVAENNLDNSLPLIEELNIEDSESVNVDTKEFYRTRDQVSFLDSEQHYSLPEYSCHMFNNTLVFTLHVKNVDPSSLDKSYTENGSSMHIKFSSISPAFVTVNYAFYLNLPSHNIESDTISIEVWDNNVVAQLSYTPADVTLTSYWAGLTNETIEEKLIEEPSVIFNKHFNNKQGLDEDDEEKESDDPPKVQINVKSESDVSVVINPEKTDDSNEPNLTNSEPMLCVEQGPSQNMKSRSYSESSGDELSVSPTKGILKLSRSRTPVSRSVSESSADDYTWSSFENCASVSDSLIPEECEASSSMKKTVRFNDVVSQQLFRTNSSILGQKKKNQRKSRNKMRARERRLSESENSESEDKKDKFKKSPVKFQENLKTAEPSSPDGIEGKSINFKNDLIFDIDI